jgi:hypothetical protein
MFVVSVAFTVVQRQGWLRKERLLDLGMVFQVAIAFGCRLFEGAAYKDPNMIVLGHSGIAVWMMLCGLLLPNAPLRAALSAILCVLMWPLAYWVDLQVFGYPPMPLSHLMVSQTARPAQQVLRELMASHQSILMNLGAPSTLCRS